MVFSGISQIVTKHLGMFAFQNTSNPFHHKVVVFFVLPPPPSPLSPTTSATSVQKESKPLGFLRCNVKIGPRKVREGVHNAIMIRSRSNHPGICFLCTGTRAMGRTPNKLKAISSAGLLASPSTDATAPPVSTPTLEASGVTTASTATTIPARLKPCCTRSPTTGARAKGTDSTRPTADSGRRGLSRRYKRLERRN